MTISGIDISSVQGTVPWDAVAARGTRFAVCKCGNGNDGHDPTFDGNVAGARAAGLVVGVYHFVYCGLPDAVGHPGRDPIDQAQAHYVASGGLGSKPGDLLPCIDLEWPAPQDWAKWGVNASMILAWVRAYLGKAEALHGRTPIVYTYPDFAAHVGFTPDFARYPLWLAAYDNIPVLAPWSGYSILQTAGGTPSALSRRFQQPTTLPNGVPVDTDIMQDGILESLIK